MCEFVGQAVREQTLWCTGNLESDKKLVVFGIAELGQITNGQVIKDAARRKRDIPLSQVLCFVC